MKLQLHAFSCAASSRRSPTRTSKKREPSGGKLSPGFVPPSSFAGPCRTYSDSLRKRNISGPFPSDWAGRVSASIAAEISIPTLVVVPANAVRAAEPAPGLADKSANKIAVRAIVGSAGIPHSSQADRRRGKIFFLAMTLARSTRPLVGCSGSFRAQPVSPALRSPLLFAAFGLAIAVSCFPLSPPPCFLPALLAAVARQRMKRAKSLFASFQQTTSSARTSNSLSVPGCSEMASLIFLAS